MAFLQSGPAREPFLKAPASVLCLIVALVAAHVGRMLVPAALSDRIVIDYGFVPLRYAAGAVDPGTLVQRAVPFVSYMFLHADATHLAVNCLWLLAFGPVVARRFGATLFLLFFLLCGVASALTYLAFNWQSAAAVIGASGAISGLMAAGIRMLRMPGVFAAKGTAGLAPILSRQVLVFSALWIGVNLLFGLTGLSMGGEVRQIAWEAHLGGYVVGLVFAGMFDRLAQKDDMDPSADA